MLQFKKSHYERPSAGVVYLREEYFLCASNLRYSIAPGTSGDDIEDIEIINGGSF